MDDTVLEYGQRENIVYENYLEKPDKGYILCTVYILKYTTKHFGIKI